MTEKSASPPAVAAAPIRPGPPGGKRELNRRAKTDALGNAAVALFLERGVEGVTIDDITREAGVAKGSFYRYFADKEALVAALVLPGREKIMGVFARAEERLTRAQDPASVQSAYMKLGREMAASMFGMRDLTRLYLQESRGPAVGGREPIRALERDIAAAALALTRTAFEHGLASRVHPEVSTLAVIGASERLLQAYFEEQLTVDPTVAVQDLVSIVLTGMRGIGG